MSNVEYITNCRLCKSSNLSVLYSFGEVPLANSYPLTQDEPEKVYPLTLMKCNNCRAVQLRETIDPTELFKNYSYATSDSPTLIKHFEEYAKDALSRFPNRNDYFQIMEIGANDSTLLKRFAKLGVTQLYGVDPATNIVEKSQSAGIMVINKFFNLETARSFKEQYGTCDLICANNVLAHVKDLDGIMEGIKLILADDGMLVMENAHVLEMFKQNLWSLVYHEHLNYFGIKPLALYLAGFGLNIIDVKKIETQGGSFRLFIKKINGKELLLKYPNGIEYSWWRKGHTAYCYPLYPMLKEIIKEEEKFGLYHDETIENFKININAIKEEFERLFIELNGKSIACYGSNAKFALMSKVLGFNKDNIKYVVDDAPLKQGKFTPGAKIPIVNRQYFIDNPPDYVIISSWNFASSIIKNNSQFEGRWIIPLPDIKILTSD